jgi:ribosomal protein S18 acetylase RimI-like enzyme
MALDIRLAREDELEQVGALTVEGYQADSLLVEDDYYIAVLADAAQRAREAELWVAVDGPDLLGSVTYCRPGSSYAELAGDHEGEFRMLAVAKAARRRGAGRALVEHCVARSEELGYDGVVLSSLPEMHNAHRLYAALGFTRDPARDWTPAPGVDLWAFHLALPR